ncbi:MAG: methylated-DNA--[protein]-cysteine S-methyltransferase [bacterium]
MSAISFSLFNSPIGHFAIAWGVRGIFTVQLPEPGERETSARLIRRFPGVRETAPPPDIQRAGEAIQALLRGESVDLSFIELDLSSVPAFHQRVYAVARTIPPGKTITYGDLAKQLGEVGLARTVGQALGRNPFALVVPCHRVLAAHGKLGGFSASGGVRMKQQLLQIEGAESGGEPSLFD